MKTITIRRALPEDASVLEPIIREAMSKYREDSGIPGSLDALRETASDVEAHIRRDLVLIAFHHDQAVGTVRISALSPDTAEISRFAVLPSAQKTGVGSKLYADAEAWILREGYRRIVLHTALTNHHTVRFYTGKGFDHAGTSTDRGYPRGLFVKNIQPSDAP